MRLLKQLIILAALCGLTLSVAADEGLRPVDQPIQLQVVDRDGQTRTGRVTGYNPREIELVDEQGQPHRLAWAGFQPANVDQLYRAVMDQDDPQHWLELGRVLSGITGGDTLSDHALKEAVTLDATLTGQADLIRRQRGRADAPRNLAAGSQNAWTWEAIDAADPADPVARDKAFAAHVAQALGLTFNVVETDYFLFYTNLSKREAYEWQRLLDLMYDRVSYLLGIPKGVNVFKGKALVFMFAEKGQFAAFERRFYEHEVTFEAALCHQHDTGEVRIALYKLEDDKYLKQVMIHEAAHGVVHRFHSPQRVVVWLNEGIAEWTASRVLNYTQPYKWKKKVSADHIRRQGRLDADFFQEGGFSAERYGSSLAMVEILLRRGRPKFVQFIREIKDGKPWQESLRDKYDLSPDDLTRLYGQTIGMPNLKR